MKLKPVHGSTEMSIWSRLSGLNQLCVYVLLGLLLIFVAPRVHSVLQATASCRKLLPREETSLTTPCVPSVVAPTTSSCAQVNTQAFETLYTPPNTLNPVLLHPCLALSIVSLAHNGCRLGGELSILPNAKTQKAGKSDHGHRHDRSHANLSDTNT